MKLQERKKGQEWTPMRLTHWLWKQGHPWTRPHISLLTKDQGSKEVLQETRHCLHTPASRGICFKKRKTPSSGILLRPSNTYLAPIHLFRGKYRYCLLLALAGALDAMVCYYYK